MQVNRKQGRESKNVFVGLSKKKERKLTIPLRVNLGRLWIFILQVAINLSEGTGS